MAKTSKQVQGDVYRLLKDSTLYTMISGEVYRNGYRPRDSRKEDAVVIFTTGLADEIQTGVVTVNIYVPDKDLFGNGVLVEDGERTEELERLADSWVESLTAEISNYKFKYYGDSNAPLNIPQSAFIDATDYGDGHDDYFPLLETEDGSIAEIIPIVKKED